MMATLSFIMTVFKEFAVTKREKASCKRVGNTQCSDGCCLAVLNAPLFVHHCLYHLDKPLSLYRLLGLCNLGAFKNVDFIITAL